MENTTTAIQAVPSQTMQPVSIQEIATQITAVEMCIKSLMKEGVHYGKIPGCGDKPTLLKPGAEMLSKLFQLRPEFKREYRDLGNGHREVLSSCTLYSRVTGLAVGEGAGSCSTMESKYRWRKARMGCPSCGAEDIARSNYPPKNNPKAPPGWYCRGCKAQFDYDDPTIRNQKAGRVENPDIADQYNTVQKVSDKRAYVAANITAVGASGFVTQDIEDFADAPPIRETSAEVVEPPKPQQEPVAPRKSGRPPKATEAAPAQAPVSTPERQPGEDDEPPEVVPAAMDGVAVAEVLKKMLEQRPPAMEWGVFKSKLAAKYPGHGLVTICEKHKDEIIADINSGKYDIEI